jgi:hypothetical protein
MCVSLCACSWFNHTNTQALPKCRFTVSSRCGGVPWDGPGSSSCGATYKWLVVGPQRWQHKANTMRHFGVQLERVQVPLLHAWAISIYKSQVCSLLQHSNPHHCVLAFVSWSGMRKPDWCTAD